MTPSRHVVLGLAQARSAWFRAVAAWAHSAAVLIMAFIGVAVWGGFRLTVDNTQKKVDAQVDQIGQ